LLSQGVSLGASALAEHLADKPSAPVNPVSSPGVEASPRLKKSQLGMILAVVLCLGGGVAMVLFPSAPAQLVPSAICKTWLKVFRFALEFNPQSR
jgi:hypothetical protein